MAKAPKETNFLISSEGSGFFYANRKNKRKSKGENKIKIKKYDPIARKHVLFEEKKLSRLKKKYKGPSEGAGEAEAPKKDVSKKASSKAASDKTAS